MCVGGGGAHDVCACVRVCVCVLKDIVVEPLGSNIKPHPCLAWVGGSSKLLTLPFIRRAEYGI